MDGYTSVLIWVSPALSCDCILLVNQWFPRIYIAALKHSSSVPKYEIYSSIYVTFFVELSERVNIKCVLVAFKTTTIECGEVGIVPYSHCLVFRRTSCVPECNVYCYKPVSGNSCATIRIGLESAQIKFSKFYDDGYESIIIAKFTDPHPQIKPRGLVYSLPQVIVVYISKTIKTCENIFGS